MNFKDFLIWREVVVQTFRRAKLKAVELNDYKPVNWSDIAKKLDIDPSRLSKYVTGITNVPAYMFFAIMDALGVLPKDWKK